MNAPTEELVVLLDETGRATGTMAKHLVHHRETPLHLAFSCYVADGDGRLLLTRRALSKPTWPGVWTNSCCGHPAPGERLSHAVRRRMHDELGLSVTDVALVLPTFRYRAVMADGTVENEMCPVLVARCPDPGALDLDPTEVEAVEWVDWEELRTSVRDGRREVSPWCAEQVAALPVDPWVSAAPAAPLPPAATL